MVTPTSYNTIHISDPHCLVYVFQDVHDLADWLADWIRDGARPIHDYAFPASSQRAKRGVYSYTHSYSGVGKTVYTYQYLTPQTHHKVPFPFTAWAVVKYH